jgi:hypothetical protein
MANDTKNNDWIVIKHLKKSEKIPYEIRIDRNGNVFIDGEPYDENNAKYQNMSVDVEKHNKVNSGEETEQMIENQKSVQRGESVTIKDINDPNKIEKTTIKY